MLIPRTFNCSMRSARVTVGAGCPLMIRVGRTDFSMAAIRSALVVGAATPMPLNNKRYTASRDRIFRTSRRQPDIRRALRRFERALLVFDAHTNSPVVSRTRLYYSIALCDRHA